MNKKQLILLILILTSVKVLYAQNLDTLSCNPREFYNTATIHFETIQTDTISLALYDTWGVQKISYFQNSLLLAGQYSVTLLGDSLQLGIYVLALISSSDTLRITVVKLDGTSSIINNNLDNNFLIYPNPTNDILNINYTLSSNSKTQIQIINSIGQTIKEISTQQPIGTYTATVDTKRFANGIYYIRFSDGVNTKQAKIIVQ